MLNKTHITEDTPNMSDLEPQDLFNLKNRDDVVLKKADNGNAIVIMDRKDYITEFINISSSHDKSIKIDCNINETSVYFWMSQSSKVLDFLTTIFWTLRVFFQETDTELVHKRFFIKNTCLEGTICNNMGEYDAASVLFKVFREKRQY